MTGLRFNRFTKNRGLSVPEIESRSLNFDPSGDGDGDWYVLFGSDYVLVVGGEGGDEGGGN